MIDPKLNEIPVKPIAGERQTTGNGKPAKGLSINDTIAAGANKSVGARGTDTSSVTSGLAEQDPSSRLDIASAGYSFTEEEIAQRAFECWQERGCPHGSPEVDWNEAVRKLRVRT
jgi:Protein of unknown function (DUF2934)